MVYFKKQKMGSDTRDNSRTPPPPVQTKSEVFMVFNFFNLSLRGLDLSIGVQFCSLFVKVKKTLSLGENKLLEEGYFLNIFAGKQRKKNPPKKNTMNTPHQDNK